MAWKQEIDIQIVLGYFFLYSTITIHILSLLELPSVLWFLVAYAEV